MSLAIWKNPPSLFLMHLSRAPADYQTVSQSQQKPIQERKVKANWKRGIWCESSIKKLTTAWRRIEEIICFVDVTDQKLLILHGLCTAKCSQGECFSSLSLSKPEWMGPSPANIAGIKMGFSCLDQPSTFLSVAGEKIKCWEKYCTNCNLGGFTITLYYWLFQWITPITDGMGNKRDDFVTCLRDKRYIDLPTWCSRTGTEKFCTA